MDIVLGDAVPTESIVVRSPRRVEEVQSRRVEEVQSRREVQSSRQVEEVQSRRVERMNSRRVEEVSSKSTTTLARPSQILSKWISDLKLLSDKGLDPTERVDTMLVIKNILQEETESIPSSLKSKLLQICTDDLLLRTDSLDRDLRFGLALVQILQLLGPRYILKALPMLKVWLLRLTKDQPSSSERKRIDRVVTEILRAMFSSGSTGVLETLALIKNGRSRSDAIILTFALQHLPILRSEILGPLFANTYVFLSRARITRIVTHS